MTMPMNESTITTRSVTLTACDKTIHTLLIDEMGRLTLNGYSATLALDSASRVHVTLTTAQDVVRCTTGAVWTALVETTTAPGIDEIGYWFLTTVLRDQQLRQWQAQYEAIQRHVTDALALALSLPTLRLPLPRLDAFTEECLARCDAHPTVAHVQSLAHLLHQTPERVSTWLAERGKAVVSDEVAPSARSYQATISSEMRQEVPETSAEQVNFLWTEERMQQLRASFHALSSKEQGNVRVAAQAIAEQRGWPVSKVRYKLYSLHWEAPHPQEIRAVASAMTSEPDVEILKRGAFLWDVQIGGPDKLQRWGLDYPYGSFPYASQTKISYKEQHYILEQAHMSLLMVRQDEQEVLLAESVGGQQERESVPA